MVRHMKVDRKSGPAHFVGVDLGVSKTLAGVFDRSLLLRGKVKISTKLPRGTTAVIGRIARCVRDAVDEADLTLAEVRGVGVGVPGTVAPEAGLVKNAPSLGWAEVPLKQELEKLLGLSVSVRNAWDTAAFGVYETDLKSKPKRMLCIFVGESVGGGLFLAGDSLNGANQLDGEIGHMVVQEGGPGCNCGKQGCFEAVASLPALRQRILTAIRSGEKTTLTSAVGEDLSRIKVGDLRKAVKRGDKLVVTVVEDAARAIGSVLADLAGLHQPEVAVLSGRVMDILADNMLDIALRSAERKAGPGALKGVEIATSSLGDDLGITGGAVLARTLWSAPA